MKRFNVNVHYIVTMYEDVLAENEEQAKQIAMMRAQNRPIGGDYHEIDFADISDESDHELQGHEMSGEELRKWHDEVRALSVGLPLEQCRYTEEEIAARSAELQKTLTERLLHHYFGEQSIEDAIADTFGKMGIDSEDYTFGWNVTQQTQAFELLVEVDSLVNGLYGYISIYYLKLREGASEEIGSTDSLYVVEISYGLNR